MSDTPTGVDEPRIPVPSLATLAGVARNRVYGVARKHPEVLPLDPHGRGIPLSFALAWLRSRDERKIARAAAALRRHDAREAKRTARQAAKQAARDALLQQLNRIREEGLQRLREQYGVDAAKGGGK